MLLLVEQVKAAVVGVVFVTIVALSAAVTIQTKRLNIAQERYTAYVAEVEATGRAAQAHADEVDRINRGRKEHADAEIARLSAERDDVQRRLRDAVASRSFVPQSRDGGGEPTRSAERACYDGAKLDAALREFAEGAAGIAGEGAGAVDALNALKGWARGNH